MKLTRATSYALHAVAYMAGLKKGQPTPSHVIAQKRGIPELFLLKVLKPLVSAQLLYSVKGPRGGYRLAQAAQDISMLQVIEAVDGPIRGQAPTEVDDPRHALNRKLAQICDEAADQLRKQLSRVRLSDLAIRE